MRKGRGKGERGREGENERGREEEEVNRTPAPLPFRLRLPCWGGLCTFLFPPAPKLTDLSSFFFLFLFSLSRLPLF